MAALEYSISARSSPLSPSAGGGGTHGAPPFPP
eukprot:CAMPEP_0194288222 /NCGR_PEP_ID=MMETSP0169-20130528/36396_1 /TAXON_ID=218684 /ORGANISM="Corethron pennatum, Strain L29A3" /LENGTH=32 /DNA_ID= /DNA_START= /DNA_END= /DNA_ORIENTATION=